MTAEHADDVRLAHVIADQVDAMTLARFRQMDFTVESKPDLTPVTEVDRAAEDLVRALLARHRRRDSVLGEEGGQTGHSSRRWVIDPIDGTKNYVRGVPVWATLIALMDGPDVVALQGRQASLEGTGEITLRRLVKEALRMRPDRLVVGEVRDAEALDLVLALNTGVPGAGTVHANSAAEALEKLTLLPLLILDIFGRRGRKTKAVRPAVAARVN